MFHVLCYSSTNHSHIDFKVCGTAYYPHDFLKSEGDIVIASVCPSILYAINHWTKLNQIWCVSYSHEWGVQRQTFLAPSPGALGRGQKVKYHLIAITKSISKIFIPNFVCVLTNERYKTYQTGFSLNCQGHAQGVGLGVLGGQNQIPSCCLPFMLSSPKPFDDL